MSALITAAKLAPSARVRVCVHVCVGAQAFGHTPEASEMEEEVVGGWGGCPEAPANHLHPSRPPFISLQIFHSRASSQRRRCFLPDIGASRR